LAKNQQFERSTIAEFHEKQLNGTSFLGLTKAGTEMWKPLVFGDLLCFWAARKDELTKHSIKDET